MSDLLKRFNLNEWKKWVDTIHVYEQKVQDVVKDLDARGKEARKKGEKQLDKWMAQLKVSRDTVEKKISTLVESERTKLTKAFNELVKNVKKAETAVKAKTKPAAKAATKTTASATAPKKKAAKSAPKSKKPRAKVAKQTVMSLGNEPQVPMH